MVERKNGIGYVMIMIRKRNPEKAGGWRETQVFCAPPPCRQTLRLTPQRQAVRTHGRILSGRPSLFFPSSTTAGVTRSEDIPRPSVSGMVHGQTGTQWEKPPPIHFLLGLCFKFTPMAPEREAPEVNVMSERSSRRLNNCRSTLYTHTRIKHGSKVPIKHLKGREKASDDKKR